MLKAVHRKSFTQLNAKFRSKDPGINGMFQAVHRKSFTKLSAYGLTVLFFRKQERSSIRATRYRIQAGLVLFGRETPLRVYGNLKLIQAK